MWQMSTVIILRSVNGGSAFWNLSNVVDVLFAKWYIIFWLSRVYWVDGTFEGCQFGKFPDEKETKNCFFLFLAVYEVSITGHVASRY